MEKDFHTLQEEFKTEYLEILKTHMVKGLALLRDLSILDEKYKDAVINLNNINNIALQLNYDLTEKDEVKEENMVAE